jgi:PAS domain S-box-containing protein
VHYRMLLRILPRIHLPASMRRQGPPDVVPDSYLSRVIDHVQDVITVIDQAGIIQFERGASAEVLGFPSGARVGENAFAYIHDEDLPAVVDAFRAGLEDPGVTGIAEYRARRADGSWTRLESRAKNLLFDDTVRGVVITSRDVSDRFDAQEDLRLREARQRALIEALPDAMVRLDADGVYLDVHVPPGYHAIDRPRSLIGMKTSDVLPPAIAEQAVDAIRSALSTGAMQIFEYEIEVAGETRAREARVVVAGELEVLSIQRDITEQREAQRDLRRLKSFYEQVLNDLPADIAVMEPSGRILYLNKGSVSDPEMREWLIGRTGLDYCERRGIDSAVALRRQRHIEEAVQKRRPVTFEEELSRSTGESRHILRIASPVLTDDGEVAQVIGYGLDISERKRAEEELRDSREQLRMLALEQQTIRESERTRIAREVHDVLGQALTALRMDVSWLERSRPESAAERLNDMKTLIDETIHAVRRISTELRPGVLDDLGLGAAIEWQASEFEKRTRILCRTSIDFPLEDFPTDRATAVFRIFQEILTNIARHADASRVFISLALTEDSVVLRVRDDGRGVKTEDVEASHSLGVLGMRERAAAVGGSVSIRGKVGVGTEVVVTVPRNPV